MILCLGIKGFSAVEDLVGNAGIEVQYVKEKPKAACTRNRFVPTIHQKSGYQSAHTRKFEEGTHIWFQGPPSHRCDAKFSWLPSLCDSPFVND